MPVTIMAKNYSHCPLKKRPVVHLVEDDSSSDEPENLSTKPEDLSVTGRYSSKSPTSTSSFISSPESPRSTVSPAGSPPMRSPSPPIHHHHHHSVPSSYYHPEIKMEYNHIKSEQPVFPTNHYNSAPISPDYAPQTWHRSIYPNHPAVGFHHLAPLQYSHPAYDFLSSGNSPSSSYSDSSSYSPPHHHHHHHVVQPLAVRPNIYSSIDQSSLSPNSSTTTSPPPQVLSRPTPAVLKSPSSVEDLSEKRAAATTTAGGGVRHKCPDCGKSYSTFSGLSKHRQFHCAAGEGPRKSFSCKYCEKVYVSLGALKMHIRTHTLPCKCTICGKAFSRPWLLQGHIRTHTGEKPFSCTYCNRAFADRSNLRAHLQTHSDVKKYSCPTCNKMFSRMSLLTKHAESGCGGPATQMMCT